MGKVLCNLSEEMILFIRNDVDKFGFSLNHLEDELIDHICCLIEEYLVEGYSFDKAYEKVKKDITIDSLKDIEIKTLLLINKNFQTMKTTLKITGITGLVSILLASLFKTFHWPGASILFLFGFVSLTLAYLPVLVFSLKREQLLKRKRNLYYAGIAAASVLLMSILFTYMHWPYKDYLTYISWILIFVFLVMLLLNLLKSEDNQIMNFSLILFFTVLFIVDITIYTFRLNNPRLCKYTIENNFEETIQVFENNSGKLYARFDSEKNDSLSNKVQAIKAETEEMVASFKNLQLSLFSSREEQTQHNQKLFKNYIITNEIESEAMQIEKKISDYRSFLLTNTKDSPELSAFLNASLQFGKFEFNNDVQVLYNNISRVIRDIRISEYSVLTELTD